MTIFFNKKFSEITYAMDFGYPVGLLMIVKIVWKDRDCQLLKFAEAKREAEYWR